MESCRGGWESRSGRGSGFSGLAKPAREATAQFSFALPAYRKDRASTSALLGKRAGRLCKARSVTVFLDRMTGFCRIYRVLWACSALRDSNTLLLFFPTLVLK